MRERMVAAGLWDASDMCDPSVSIEAAWGVLGRFAEFMVLSRWKGERGCWALVDNREPTMSRPDQHMAKGDSYPHAICLAALKAVAASGTPTREA